MRRLVRCPALLAAVVGLTAAFDTGRWVRADEGARASLSDAVACERRGDPAGAEARAKAAVHAAATAGDAVLLGAGVHVLGRLAARGGRWTEALALLRDALDRADALAAPLDDESAATLHGAAVASADLGVAVASALDDVEAAFHFAERGRAGALRTARAFHAARPCSLRPRSAAATATREAEARAVAAYRAALGVVDDGHDLLHLRARADVARRASVAETRHALRAERSAHPIARAPPTTVRALQRRLRADEAYVAYVLCDPGATAIVVTPDDAWLAPLGARDDVARACDALLTGVARRADLSASVARLRALVVEPLRLDARVHRLAVSPDGVLAHVPPTLWLAEFEVVYTPCATPLAGTGPASAAAGEAVGGVLALGDPALPFGGGAEAVGAARPRDRVHTPGRLEPLPFAGREARAVGDVALVGAAATVPNFARALASRPRWRAIHLACHVWSDDATPGLASLVLAPAPGDAGLLGAAEWARWRLDADLVVLSGCRSGAGPVVRGEGALGLTWAALAAGAREVVSAAWPVDDEAAGRLWIGVHTAARRAPQTPTVRLVRAAQADLRRDPRFAHAAYTTAWIVWRPFVADAPAPGRSEAVNQPTMRPVSPSCRGERRT